MTLKERFLDAIINGELGVIEDKGVIVCVRDFINYFADVKSQYTSSFLPAAVIETGQYSATHTRYLFRVRKGVYLVHPDAIEQHRRFRGKYTDINESRMVYVVCNNSVCKLDKLYKIICTGMFLCRK